MKSTKDILAREELQRYKQEWLAFPGRYKLNDSYNVHSGLPVISQVFQFENYPLFQYLRNKRQNEMGVAISLTKKRIMPALPIDPKISMNRSLFILFSPFF